MGFFSRMCRIDFCLKWNISVLKMSYYFVYLQACNIYYHCWMIIVIEVAQLLTVMRAMVMKVMLKRMRRMKMVKNCWRLAGSF